MCCRRLFGRTSFCRMPFVRKWCWFSQTSFGQMAHSARWYLTKWRSANCQNRFGRSRGISRGYQRVSGEVLEAFSSISGISRRLRRSQRACKGSTGASWIPLNSHKTCLLLFSFQTPGNFLGHITTPRSKICSKKPSSFFPLNTLFWFMHPSS